MTFSKNDHELLKYTARYILNWNSYYMCGKPTRVNLIPLQHKWIVLLCAYTVQNTVVGNEVKIPCLQGSSKSTCLFFAFHMNKMVLNFQNRKKFYFIYEGPA